MIINQQQKYHLHNIKFTAFRFEQPDCVFGNYEVVFGIDPGGRYMGLTILERTYHLATSYEIEFPSERLVIPRATQIRLALSDIIFLGESWKAENILVAVEGSSFASPYRNTELAEARLTAALWFKDKLEVEEGNFVFIPPLTVRKYIFGNAKIRAEEQWPELKPDAASSLAIALAGLKLHS